MPGLLKKSELRKACRFGIEKEWSSVSEIDEKTFVAVEKLGF
jgi:hypothetical protein